MSKPKRMMDAETGEIRTLIDIDAKPRKVFTPSKDQFTLVYHPAYSIMRPKLNVAEWELLWTLVTSVPIGAAMDLNLSKMSREVGWVLRTAQRALAGLTEKGIVIRDPDDRELYWLNPEYAWRGDEADRKRAHERLNGGGR